MKYYYCKICNSRGKKFTGNRQMVRKHLREEHLIKRDKTKSLGAEEYENI